jgi:hypothetical protein
MTNLFKTNPFSLVVAILAVSILSCSVLQSVPAPATTPIPAFTTTPTLIHTSMPIPNTETPAPSFTPTNTSTPEPSVTPPPRSTRTSTPQPAWVTDFAQPVLDVIALRTPSFQDNFGPGSAGWKEDWCEGSMKYIEGELVVTNCRVFRPNIDWRDFALEVDMRFLKDTKSSAEWALHFRDLGNSGHVLSLYHTGDLAISFTKAKGPSTRVEFDYPGLSDDQIHHLLLIAKGTQFAFYLDGKPFYYAEDDAYLFGRCVFFVESGAAAMDNFKIWDISDIPTP